MSIPVPFDQLGAFLPFSSPPANHTVEIFAVVCSRFATEGCSNSKLIRDPANFNVQVQFFIRGPNGTGMVTSEMFKDRETRDWQFTYLIVDITSPVPSRIMLESYLGGPSAAGG